MLTIRFNRTGKKNKSYYRIVLQEHTVAPGGRHIAILGSYDPHLKKAVLKAENIKEWIGKGAQVSDSAYNLFVKEGVLEGKKRVVKVPKKAVPEVLAEPVDVKALADKEVKEIPKESASAEATADNEVKVEEKKVEEAKVEEPKAEEAKKEEPVDSK
jgi:small subunit ribosomal protein S16